MTTPPRQPWEPDPQLYTQPIPTAPAFDPAAQHGDPHARAYAYEQTVHAYGSPPPAPGQAPYPVQPPYPPRPQPPRSLAWLWVALGALTVVLLGVIGYVLVWPLIANDSESDQASTATHTVVVTSPAPSAVTPAPAGAAPAGETLPAHATRCGSVFDSSEFSASAVGSSVTSCEFAEEVRFAYVSQTARRSTVVLDARSPVTGQTYTMTCSGQKVVTCTGGNNAIVYVY